MKKIYILIFAYLSVFSLAQPCSSFLKNTDWTITKIQWDGVDYYPPSPLMQSGKAAFDYDNNNGFSSTFYNSAVGKITFAADNACSFTLQNMAVTLAVYIGENEQAVRDFDNKATTFYLPSQPTDQFTFAYEQIYSGKNLTVSNKNGNKIFYSNLILASGENELSKPITVYPNPAKNEFYLKTSGNSLKLFSVEIFDSSGKLISQQRVFGNEAINVQNLSNGVYQIKISNLQTKFFTRLIIEK